MVNFFHLSNCKILAFFRFSERTLKQWVEKVKDDSVACAPVNNLEEAFADPQVRV